MNRITKITQVCIVLLGAALISSAWAGTDQNTHPTGFLTKTQHMRAALIKDGHADALFTASLLPGSRDGGPTPRQRLQLIDRAVKLAPGEPVLAVAALQVCAGMAECDQPSYVQRLHAVAPNDARPLLSVLHSASKAGDEQAIDQALAQMATRDSLHDYYLASANKADHGLARLPADAFADTKVPDWAARARRYASATAIVSATIMPSFASLAHTCNPDKAGAAFADRRAACGKIGALLQHGDSLISNMLGLRLAEWAASTDAERKAIQQQRRTLQWQREAWSTAVADNPVPPDTNFAELDAAQRQALHAYLDDQQALWAAMRKAGSEIGGIRARLTARGLPLEPPADWHPRRWKATHANAADN